MKTKKQFGKKMHTSMMAYIQKNKIWRPILIIVCAVFINNHAVLAQEKYEMFYDGGGQGEYIQNSKPDTNDWGIGFFTEFSMRMNIANNGNVGIGTLVPYYKLDLGNNPNPSKVLAIHTSGSGPSDFFYGFGNDNRNGIGYLDIYAGDATNTAAIAVGHNGNVGIGTTSPVTRLHVKGNGNSGTIRIVPDNQGNESSVGFYENPDGVNGNSWIVGQNGWGNAGDFTIGWTTTNTGSTGVKFLVQSDGNIGIGTTSPSTMLDVNGTGHFSNDVDIDGNVNIDGNVGIGTTSPSDKLEVDGTVRATSFTSSAASFPDYVFANDYTITPLSELEAYVKTNKHLPNMPSEKEVVEQGLNLPEVVIKSVENIETIYLHLIRMEKEIKALQQENAALRQQLKENR